MSKKTFILISIIVFSLVLAADDGGPLQLVPRKPYVPDRAVIKISGAAVMQTGNVEAGDGRIGPVKNLKNHPPSMIMAKYQSQIKQLKAHRLQDYYIAETIEGCDIETLCQQLRREPFILDASPDYYAVITSTVPDDLYIQYQYGLYNTGQVYFPETGLSGTGGSDIKATDGWDWTRGSESVIIAIIDSGVAMDHEDLH